MKYTPLEHHLQAQTLNHIELRFCDIERIIGATLPPSARRHRAWWSNNPSNSVATYAWLNAGYRSAQVDMAGERLVFERRGTATPTSLSEPARTPYRAAGAASLYGQFRGVFKFVDGTALSAPTGECWAADHE
ncbi:hypothetical protein [uncultured Maricaulis sp.]|uniref:DUF7662 domain-containing protein n=1 Tax=uncultured Maricaulis sp. TaxID=174710 RepID=UPI0030D6DA64|tara:strand:- start:36681 stop:37079 length:399 start_codon:yes stop_codon:yes gene_type:complete